MDDETTEETIARKELVIRKLLNYTALSTTLLLLKAQLWLFHLRKKSCEIVCFIAVHAIKQESNINKMYSFL